MTDESSAPEGMDLGRLLFQQSNDFADLMDEITYRSYRYNRDRKPDISPESWALVFIDAAKLEARYQEECHARKA